MRKETTIVLLTMSILSSMTIGCVANTPDGVILFEKERCIYCHSFKGQGAQIGPDFTDIAKRRRDEWIRDQIRNPKLHYPNPGMPGHEYLSRKQINAMVKYLKSGRPRNRTDQCNYEVRLVLKGDVGDKARREQETT